MIGCQANQSNTRAVLDALREDMWQNELDQLMRSRSVELIGTRNLGAGRNGEAQDYRLGDKVLRVSLEYPGLSLPPDSRLGRNERFVTHWKFVDIEAERRREREVRESMRAEREKYLKMSPSERRRYDEEHSRWEKEYSRFIDEWLSEPDPDAKEKLTPQPGRPEE